MVEVSNKHKSITVGVSSNNGNTIVTAKSDTAQYWANQSHTFADQAKESVQEAKNYAELANSYIEGFENVVTSNTNNIITTINQITNTSIANIETSRVEAVDSINSTKTTILNDIGFVADGEKKELNDLADEIKDNADAIINRVGFNMFDTVLKDHVLTYEESKGLALQGTYVYKDAIAGSRYGYPDFYNKCLKERNEAKSSGGVQRITLGGTTISMYIHANGHMYYDISIKATVDSWFNTFGTAWFYGVDTENERIFLPRTLWFEQMTNDKTQVGLSVDAGLPNITGGFAVGYGSSGGANSSLGKAIYSSSTVCNMHAGNGSNNSKQLALDASKSSSVYGNSTTVQPNAVKKLLYICVGNTVSDTSWVDVVTQVQGGVKDLEDKTNEGISALANASNALRTTQITNCITEIPQRIKYTLENGTLTIPAGSVVIVPYGTENKTNQFPKGATFLHENFKVYDTQFAEGRFFVWAEVQNDVKLTGAGRATGKCPLMLSITNNSLAFNDLKVTGSGADYTADTTNYTYYDTTLNNVYKRDNTSTAWFPDVWAFPLGTFTRNAGTISLINQVFNGFGYIGSTAWADKGIKYLSSNGRNADETLRNAEFVTKILMIDTLQAESRTYFINKTFWSRRVTATCFEQPTMPTLPLSTHAIWLNTDENQMYAADSGDTVWHKTYGFANIGTAGLSDFSFKQPFRAVDYNDKSEVSGWSMPSGKYIDLTLGASGTTYTAPANGWVDFRGTTNTNNQNIKISNNTTTLMSSHVGISANGVGFGTNLPVKRGDIFQVGYGAVRDYIFRFIYAEGEV